MFDLNKCIEEFNEIGFTIETGESISCFIDRPSFCISIETEESEFNDELGHIVLNLIVSLNSEEESLESVIGALSDRQLSLWLKDDKEGAAVGVAPFTRMGCACQLLAYPSGKTYRLELILLP